jgi:hypothetical protein
MIQTDFDEKSLLHVGRNQLDFPIRRLLPSLETFLLSHSLGTDL